MLCSSLTRRAALVVVDNGGFKLIRSFLFNYGNTRFHRGSLTIPPSFPSSFTRKAFHSRPNYSTRPKQDSSSSPDKPNIEPQNQSHLENYSDFYRRLAQSLPHLQRPTRDDFLKVASGFWQRLSIHFKWFTIKSFRKFNADDISAFVTWFLMSQTLWILVGTTTFFSVVFATANSLSLQHYIARAISNYLTSETGVTVIFESAIVPKWKDSRISFKNVYISRRPPETSLLSTANTSHLTDAGHDASGHSIQRRAGDGVEDPVTISNANISTFDLNVDSIDVTLSLRKWLDGKGLVDDAVVKGVRGIFDRRSIKWSPNHPASFRSKSRPGDFELNSLQLEDVLITVYQPGDFRPFTFSIFRADLRSLRKQWFFYDLLRAENIVGQFDNCLFSLHRPQSISRTTEVELMDGKWERISRIRIDGVAVDHIQNSTTYQGPISWITSGKLDAVVDIKFPRDASSDLDFNAIIDAITTTLDLIPGQRELAKPPITTPDDDTPVKGDGSDDASKVEVDIDLRFRDIKAAVPIFTRDLSYINNALIRPIVAFMNANHTLIPIRSRVVKDISEFDGSWTLWETGLMDDIAQKTYAALAYHVTRVNMNRRIKHVGVWSLQMTANALLTALRNVIDPISANLRELYAYGFPYDILMDPVH